MRNQAILLLSKRTDAFIIAKYKEIEKSCKNVADIYLLLDKTDEKGLLNFSKIDNIFNFDIGILTECGYIPYKNKLVPGNSHIPILRFYLAVSKYDYYWVIEDDAIFTGFWDYLLDFFVDDNSDLITSFVRCYKDDPTWFWWSTLYPCEGALLCQEEMYASFNPIYRISARGLKCLDINLRKGWRGHSEALLPTILKKKGLRIKDFNNKNSTEQNCNKKIFYTERTHSWLPLCVQKFVPNMIYHPIKEKWSNHPYRKNCVISVVKQKNNCKLWLRGAEARSFDLHLIVSSRTFNIYYDYADFVYYKNDSIELLVYDYFKCHPYLMDIYDFYFILKEDAETEYLMIDSLFAAMEQNNYTFVQFDLTSYCFSKKTLKSLLSILQNSDGWKLEKKIL